MGRSSSNREAWLCRLARLARRVAVVAMLMAAPVIATNALSAQPSASINAFDGEWYSPQWKYGYRLRNGVGIATISNSPKFKTGDEIIRIKPDGPNAFSGYQVYTDGRWYAIRGVLQRDGKLHIQGEKNIAWTMDRAGAQHGSAQPAGLHGAAFTLDGLGPVRIGMTPVEAAAAAGVQLVAGGTSGRCSSFHPKNGPEGLTLTVAGGRVVKISAYESSRLGTAEGVRLGDPEQKVINAYSGKFRAYRAGDNPHRMDALVYAPVGAKPADNIMVFNIGGGKLSWIHLGRASHTRDEQQGNLRGEC